ncbi:MAG: PIN domain-containing protein [Acetobacteraceae bacterium]
MPCSATPPCSSGCCASIPAATSPSSSTRAAPPSATAIYDRYKAQRPEPPPELIPQFALVRDATAAFNVPAIELPDWEADDLIAAYAAAATEIGARVTIVSSDKDLMQLIRPASSCRTRSRTRSSPPPR